MQDRPRAVSIVVAFLFAATVIAWVVGVSLLWPNQLMDWLWQLNRPAEPLFRRLGWIAGAGLLLLGAGTLGAAFGWLRRKRWAWLFAVIGLAINGVGDVVSLIVTGDWLRSASGIAIAGSFLYVITRSRVRRYFRTL